MESKESTDDLETQKHLLTPEEYQNDVQATSESESSGTSADSEAHERGKWSSQIEFILACVGFSVAFGNIMRFPYLCMRNGGGAFLIPFFFFMIVCGFPLYYLEVCLGQFSSSSPLFVWRLAPLLKGLGWLMVLISGIVSWYYNIIIMWVLYYLVNSFRPTLPWSTCGNDWNTKFCRPSNPEEVAGMGNASLHLNHTDGYAAGHTNYTAVVNNDTEVVIRNVSSAKEFWQYNMLRQSESIEDVGVVQWHLVLSLLGAWVLVFLCLIKGVKSVGKVVYVTALLPFVLLTVFFIRGLTLPGASDGVDYYIKPKFHRLLDSQSPPAACPAQFTAYPSVLTIHAFFLKPNLNKKPEWIPAHVGVEGNEEADNAAKWDSIIACLADSLTSFFSGFVIFPIIGYMAYELKQPIEEVATSGPGLMFIAYPEAIAKMPLPHLWAVLFFIMLITVGLDTQFCMFETLSSGIVDAFPEKLSNRKTLVTAALSAAMFLLGLPFTTNAGIYIYQLIDWYSSSICMCLGGSLEFVAVAWYYGAERFSRDMEMMLGYRAPILLRICWCIISPTVFFVILLVILKQYQPVTYLGYVYPEYVIIIGIFISLIPVLPLPIGMVMAYLGTSGTFLERLRKLSMPENWGPGEKKYQEIYATMEQPKAHSILEYITMNLFSSWSGKRHTHRMELSEPHVVVAYS